MLKQRLKDDMKAAMKGGDKKRLGVLRLILAGIQRREVDERRELGDDEVMAVLDKMVKQRRDSIEQYTSAARVDLADQERYELGVCQDYLPQALTDEALLELVEEVIASAGATGMRDMGKVMAEIKPKAQGRTDMGAVSRLVKERLGAA